MVKLHGTALKQATIYALVLIGCFLLFKAIYGNHGHPLKKFVPPTQRISVPSPIAQPLPAPASILAVPLSNKIALLTIADYTPALQGKSLAQSLTDPVAFSRGHPLVTHLVKSLVTTYEPQYSVSIYVAYKYEDPLFDDEACRIALHTAIAELVGSRAIKVLFVPLFAITSETAILNELADSAYRDGHDYYMPIGQSTHFLTHRWAIPLMDQLSRNEIAPGFGVAMLKFDGEPHRPRLCMVSRTHIDIMRRLLPIPFEKYVIKPMSVYLPLQLPPSFNSSSTSLPCTSSLPFPTISVSH